MHQEVLSVNGNNANQTVESNAKTIAGVTQCCVVFAFCGYLYEPL